MAHQLYLVSTIVEGCLHVSDIFAAYLLGRTSFSEFSTTWAPSLNGVGTAAGELCQRLVSLVSAFALLPHETRRPTSGREYLQRDSSLAIYPLQRYCVAMVLCEQRPPQSSLQTGDQPM
jgi:hypothetical protein